MIGGTEHGVNNPVMKMTKCVVLSYFKILIDLSCNIFIINHKIELLVRIVYAIQRSLFLVALLKSYLCLCYLIILFIYLFIFCPINVTLYVICKT